MQYMSATNCKTIHHSYNRLRQTTNLHLYIKNIQTGNSVTTNISASSFDMHVTTRAKSLIASPCKYYYTYRETLATICERPAHLLYSQRCESITITRTVNGNFSNLMILFKEDFFKIKSFYRFPCALCHSSFCIYVLQNYHI